MIVLDTHVLSELMRPEPSATVIQWMSAQPLAVLHVTTLSYAEILYGIGLLPEDKRRHHLTEQAQTMFGEDFSGRILDFDVAAASAYAVIAAQRRLTGQPISVVDGMIAAIAHVHGAAIATRDSDLGGCGVPLVNPWKAA